jgi:hypothetical protein
MNREKDPKVYVLVVVGEREDKLAMIKDAIREGSYQIKAGDIAEKILRARLFEAALTLYARKYQKRGDN